MREVLNDEEQAADGDDDGDSESDLSSDIGHNIEKVIFKL